MASLSPFTTVLKYYAANHQAISSHKIGTMLQQALDDIGFSSSTTTVSSLEVLTCSLRGNDQWKAEASLFEFLDECFVRLAKKPVKYYDDSVAVIYENKSNDEVVKPGSLGPFLYVILEQWPFLVKSASNHNLRNLTMWFTRYLGFCVQAGENTIVLSYYRNQIQQLVSDAEALSMLNLPLEKLEKLPEIRPSMISDDTDESKAIDLKLLTSQPETSMAQVKRTGTKVFLEPGPPSEVHDERDLSRWTKKEIRQATLDGDVGALVLCLCSKDVEIRNHALNSLRILLGNLEV